jgi:hypothetical protein
VPAGHAAENCGGERADLQLAAEGYGDVGQSLFLPVDQEHPTQDLVATAGAIGPTEIGFQEQTLLSVNES